MSTALTVGLACLLAGFLLGVAVNRGITVKSREAAVQEPENRSDEGEAGS